MSERPPVSAAQCVLDWARRRPDSIALAAGGQSCTYAELAEIVANLARTLIAEGARPGMIIGLLCANPLWTLFLQMASEVAGAAWIPLSAAELTPEDETAQRCQMFLVDVPADGLAAVGKVLRIDRDFLAGAQRTAATPQDLERLAVERGPDHAYAVARTSGATGKPKFVLKLLGRLAPSMAKDDVITGPVLGDYTFLALYKPTIMGVYGNVFRALLSCNTIAFLTSAEELLTLRDGRRAYAWLLTRDAERLAEMCAARGVYLDLYFADIVGSALPRPLFEEMTATLSSKIVNVYSSNETGPIASLAPDGSYAVAPGVEVRIVDEAGDALQQGEVGRIEVRSDHCRIGYLWDDALNARQVRDGWFLTSDLGSIPAPGRLIVIGRADDMLNVGGVKVAPGPIEEALKRLVGVSDAVLLPTENAKGLGGFCAAIECRDGANPQALLPEINTILAREARNYSVHFEMSFPRTETGKVQRKSLQARIVEMFRKSSANEPDQLTPTS
jgi:acyl-coenzyme A synthetase/AMP-(fatty) acid ligase